MDTKKLEKWADLLLNTNKNNRFLNVDDNSTSVADILLPAANELFGKIDVSTTFEVFDPRIIEEDDDSECETENDQLQIEVPETQDRRAVFLSQHSSKIRRQNQLLLYNQHGLD